MSKRYVGPRIAGGVKPEEFDVFHEMIAIDEVARCGSGGVLWGLFAGLSIGLPPLLYFANPALQDKVLPHSAFFYFYFYYFLSFHFSTFQHISVHFSTFQYI